MIHPPEIPSRGPAGLRHTGSESDTVFVRFFEAAGAWERIPHGVTALPNLKGRQDSDDRSDGAGAREYDIPGGGSSIPLNGWVRQDALATGRPRATEAIAFVSS
jgi:hypothetical protein